MADRAESSALIAPSPMREPSEVDLEAGPGEQIQCRICLETDGNSERSFVFSEITCCRCVCRVLCSSCPVDHVCIAVFEVLFFENWCLISSTWGQFREMSLFRSIVWEVLRASHSFVWNYPKSSAISCQIFFTLAEGMVPSKLTIRLFSENDEGILASWKHVLLLGLNCWISDLLLISLAWVQLSFRFKFENCRWFFLSWLVE